MKVLIRVRQVYGNTLYYPENETAKLFAQISRRKTLDKETLDLIKQLGFQIEIAQEQI